MAVLLEYGDWFEKIRKNSLEAKTSGLEILRKVTRLKKYHPIPTKCYSTLEMRSEPHVHV